MITIRACVWTALIILSLQLTVAGQAASNVTLPIKDWQGLSNVKPGRSVTVKTKDGRTVEAKFADLMDDKLNLSIGFRIISFEQRNIERVYFSNTNRKKKALVGAIAGGVAGLVIGGVIGARLDTRARANGPPFQDALTTGDALALYSMLGGAAAGYGLGHLIGDRPGKLLYTSK